MVDNISRIIFKCIHSSPYYRDSILPNTIYPGWYSDRRTMDERWIHGLSPQIHVFVRNGNTSRTVSELQDQHNCHGYFQVHCEEY